AFARAERSADPQQWRRDMPTMETSPALSSRPALRAAIPIVAPMAARRATGHPKRVPPGPNVGEIVRDIERRLGRPAEPFRLTITQVSVRGELWARLTETHVLTSATFWLSDKANAALRAVIEELA